MRQALLSTDAIVGLDKVCKVASAFDQELVSVLAKMIYAVLDLWFNALTLCFKLKKKISSA